MQRIVKISEAANLAIHALALLAGLPAEGAASVTQIGQQLGVSESHLGKVLQRLVKSGLLHSLRGARGGFQLVVDPRQVTLLRVLEDVDGPLEAGGCLLGTPVCHQPCRLRPLLEEVTERMRSELSGLTIADLALPSRERAAGSEPPRAPTADRGAPDYRRPS